MNICEHAPEVQLELSSRKRFHRNLASATGRLLDDPVAESPPIRFPLTTSPFQDDIRYNITNLRNTLEAGFDDDMPEN